MIRKATAADIDAVEKIYDKIHGNEKSGLSTIGWVEGIYPIRQTAENAHKNRWLYVCEKDKTVVASAIINHVQVPEYCMGNWQFDAYDSEVLVLYTLTVDPEEAGAGIGKQFVAFYEQLARKTGCTVLRIDTNERNTRARRFYAKLGFREAGIVPCDFNGIPDIRLVLLEKKL